MSCDPFEFTQAIYDEIVTHARQGKPQEVCGIMRGRGARAFELVRGRNVAPDPINDYIVDTHTLLLQVDFEDEGDEMVAIYHSHPVSPAFPSASDAWNAHYPDCAYIICSLEDEKRPVVRAFRLTPHEIDLELTVLRANLKFYETRPGLFAYYQPEDGAFPSALAVVCSQANRPFYIIFQLSNEEGKKPIFRVVSVAECEIQL